MSRPRENRRKIREQISTYGIFNKIENCLFRLGRFWSKFALIQVEPCRKMCHFSRKKPEKRFLNCVVRKFFENFSWVNPRSTHQDESIELPFV